MKLKMNSKSYYFIIILIEIVISLVCCFVNNGIFNKYFVLGSLFWGIFLTLLYTVFFIPETHSVSLTNAKPLTKRICIISFVIISIIAAIFALSLFNTSENNKYAHLVEGFLQGHLYMDYGPNPGLKDLANPYDYAERIAHGIDDPWDEAYYNGHYYCYFGVVPAVLLFLPYRLITGQAFSTVSASMIFVIFAIAGMFAIIYEIAEKWFKTIPLGMYIFLSVTLSFVSILYLLRDPRIYGIAILSGVTMEIWSLFFYFRGVYIEENFKKEIMFCTLGALFGILALGCRPPVAFGNLLAIPMLFYFIKKNKKVKKLPLYFFIVIIPYLVIGALLGLYNYLRFDSPFEFGQTYQLTLADQTQYKNFFGRLGVRSQIKGFIYNFFLISGVSKDFPYITFNGAFFNYIILSFIFLILLKPVRKELSENRILFLVLVMLLIPLIITSLDVIYSPFLIERYKSDFYFLSSLADAFIIFSAYNTIRQNTKKIIFSRIVCVLSIFTLLNCFLLFIIPFDYNYTYNAPEKLDVIHKIITLGFWRQ